MTGRTEIQISYRETSELILKDFVTELGRALYTEEQPEEGTEHPKSFSEGSLNKSTPSREVSLWLLETNRIQSYSF